jgi:hypothetical protein
MLIGRDLECRRIDELVDRLPDHGGALLVRGEAGIGKSALLDRARERAEPAGVRAVATIGVESQTELAFAGLHQLLRPFIGLTERLPDPQRLALEAALGINDRAEPDMFLVAAAAFQLLCEAAESTPILLIVDDAQWLDPSTVAVLTFVARRAEGERIVLVAAVRNGYPTPLRQGGLPTLRLERLRADAAAELLDRDAPGLHPLVRARVLDEAAGNPLALGELARAISPTAAERLAQQPSALTARLEQAFAGRLGDVPEEGRLLLLAAALDGYASLDELLKAAAFISGAPMGLSTLDAAVEAQLVELDGTRLLFCHPLIRSAVRQVAPPGQVLTMYGALAETAANPERRLWHRAMAAVGPDEEIAAALESQAALARRRGAVGVAAAALERAAALTPDPRGKGERLVHAAAAAYDLGLIDAARNLIEQVEASPMGALEAARLAWLRQMISGDVWVQSGATRTFVEIAERMFEGGDADMALGSLVPIAHRCWWTPTRARTREYLVEAAEGMSFPEDDPRLLAVIGLADPEGSGPSIRRRTSRTSPQEIGDPVAAMDIGIAAEKAGDFVTGERFLGHAATLLREQGRLGGLTQALVHYAWAAAHTGAWEAAATAGTDAARLATDTRQPQFGLTGKLMVALAGALRGTEPDLEEMIAAPERALLAVGGGPLLAPAHLARGADAIGDAAMRTRSTISGRSSMRGTRPSTASCGGRPCSTWWRPGATSTVSASPSSSPTSTRSRGGASRPSSAWRSPPPGR